MSETKKIAQKNVYAGKKRKCPSPELCASPVRKQRWVDHEVLHLLHPHPRDSQIKFDEPTHVYSIDWDGTGEYVSEGNVSVSKVYKKHFEEFDSDRVIDRMMSSRRWSYSKYYGLTKTQIKKEWETNRDEAATAGSLHHLACELHYNGMNSLFKGSGKNTKAVEQFLQFTEDHARLRPFRTEWQLWTDRDHLLCGTPDILFFSPDHVPGSDTLTLTMYDWKNSKKIHVKPFNSKDVGKGAFECVPNTNYHHYAIQLNTYKYFLEKYYAPMKVGDHIYNKILIDEMYIVVMHDTIDSYQKMILPEYQERVQAMMEDRKEDVRHLTKKQNDTHDDNVSSPNEERNVQNCPQDDDETSPVQ